MKWFPVIALALLAACQSAAQAPKRIALSAQSLAIPEEKATLPAEILSLNCAACHSPEMILTQPKLTPAQWQAEVAKMRGAYHASIDAQDDQAIVAALLALPNQK